MYDYYYFFSHLMFYYQILCFITSNYLYAYKQLLFILTVAYEIPPPLRNSVVYLNFTDYQMKP